MFPTPSITRGSSTLPSGLGQCDSTSQSAEGSSDPITASPDDVSMAPGTSADINSDPLASYFSDWDPNTPPKVLTTTSQKATKATYTFCEEPAEIFPGSEFIGGKGGRGFEIVGLRGGLQTEHIRRRWSWTGTRRNRVSNLCRAAYYISSPEGPRRNHADSSPERSSRILQADIDRTLETYICETAQNVIR